MSQFGGHIFDISLLSEVERLLARERDKHASVDNLATELQN